MQVLILSFAIGIAAVFGLWRAFGLEGSSKGEKSPVPRSEKERKKKNTHK